MHALIQNDTITQVGRLPRIWWDGERYWDWRTDQTGAHEQGWHEIQATERPEDTETTVYESSVELRDGEPVQAWTARDKTHDERTADARLDSIEARLALVEAAVFPAAPDPDPATGDAPVWADYGGVAPINALVAEGGKVWRNVAGVPLTHPPSGFPGWTEADLNHLWRVVQGSTEPDDPDPDPGDVIAWASGQNVEVGDLRTHDGSTWRALMAHTTHAGWVPGPATHAVWALVPD